MTLTDRLCLCGRRSSHGGAVPNDTMGHVWTPAVQEESDYRAKRSGAVMYAASHDGISVKNFLGRP